MAVTQKFSGDANELLREMEKIRQKNIQLEEQMQKMARASKDTSEKQVKDFNALEAGAGRFIKQIASIAAGWVSATSVLNTFKQSLDDAVQKAERARQANLGVAEAQSAVLMNIGNVSDATAKQFLQQVGGVATKSGFQSQAPVLSAASSVLSATGGNRARTLQILESTAPFFRSNQGELAQFGGVLGDVMKSTGIQDADTALAFALGVQGQSRFEQLGGFKNVSPVLAGASIGAPRADRALVARQAAALFAGVGGELGDPEGGVTKTAVLKLIENLSVATGGQGDLFQMLSAVQADPTKRGKFKEFEGQAKLLMQALTTDPNSQIAQAVQSAFGNISADPSMVATKRQQLATLTQPLSIAAIEAQSAGAAEASQLAGVGGYKAQGREIFKRALEEYVPFVDRMGSMWGYGIAASDFDAVNAATGELKRHRARATISGRAEDAEGLTRQIQLMEQMLIEMKTANNKPSRIPGGNEPD